MVPPSFADDSYGGAALARPIELRDVDTLPPAQRDVAVSDCEGHRVADENRLHVRGTVAFRVRVLGIPRDGTLERGEEVLPHVGVGVLVHEDRRGGVRDAHGDHAVAHLRPRNRRLHASRDVDGLLALRAHDRDRLVADGHADLPVADALRRASRGCPSDAELPARPTMRAISAGVALPPLTTRTVFPPRRSTFPARTAASGAAPEGSTSNERRSR